MAVHTVAMGELVGEHRVTLASADTFVGAHKMLQMVTSIGSSGEPDSWFEVKVKGVVVYSNACLEPVIEFYNTADGK